MCIKGYVRHIPGISVETCTRKFSYEKMTIGDVLARSRDWRVLYPPETNFWWRQQKLTMASPINFLCQKTFSRKFQGRSMSPTSYTKKSISNAKYWSRFVKCGQVLKWVICTCAETLDRMWFWPRNVPKVILLTVPKFHLNFSRGSGLFAERVNAGSPSKIRRLFTSPVHTQHHPLYARRINAGTPP